MKTNFITYLLLIVSISITIVSCNSSDEITLEDNTNSLETVITEIIERGENENKVVDFSLITRDGLNFSSDNIVLKDRYNKDFEMAYNGETPVVLSKNYNNNGVIVHCSGGTQNGVGTQCGGNSEASCVASAVRRCLDGGGCAHICLVEAQITYFPRENLILISSIELLN